MKPTNHYAVLGVVPTATPADIRDAYVRRLKESHPDLDPRVVYPLARVQDLQQAYHCLRDPEARAVHDASLRAADLVRASKLRRAQRRLVARNVAAQAPRSRSSPRYRRPLDAKPRWRRVLIAALVAAAGLRWFALI